MPYVVLPAGRVHYAERGERRPGRASALFIHGAGASSAIWSMTLPRVARFAHAVAIDLPGHGPSERGAGPLSLERHRDATGGLAGALCLGPSVLVGHSMGALVALAATLAWPDKVRALVLCAAAPRMSVDPELARLLKDDPERVRAWLADHGLSAAAKPSVRRGFLAAGSPAPPEVVGADFELVAATDLTAALVDIGCPITWLDGADDRLVAPRALGSSRPGQAHAVPGAGHLLPIEAPGAIANAVQGALAQLG